MIVAEKKSQLEQFTVEVNKGRAQKFFILAYFKSPQRRCFLRYFKNILYTVTAYGLL